MMIVQIQLGWAPVNESDDPRWNAKALADFEGSRKKGEQANKYLDHQLNCNERQCVLAQRKEVARTINECNGDD